MNVKLLRAAATLAFLSTASPGFASSYTFTTLMDPAVGSNPTQAFGINDAGQIVGQAVNAGNPSYPEVLGFVYSGGTYTTLIAPGAATGGTTVANGINNNGQIVGFSGNGGVGQSGSPQPFLYSGGTYTTLNVPGVIGGSYASGINNNGQIVGYFGTGGSSQKAFLYSGGTYTTLSVPGATITDAFGINDHGQIVGIFENPAQLTLEGFLYNPVPACVLCSNYTTLNDPLASSTVVTGINDQGQIVGYYYWGNGANSGYSAFLYSDGIYTTINDPFGVGTTYAYGINNVGQIVGQYDDNGETFGFLATPVPSTPATPLPAALPLFATGLGVMGLFGWRRKRKNAAALAAL